MSEFEQIYYFSKDEISGEFLREILFLDFKDRLKKRKNLFFLKKYTRKKEY